MNKYSPILQDLILAFKNLPGIGIKSAQRIVFYLLQHDHTEKAVFLSETIQKSLETIQECQICRMYSEKETCEICDDSKRDPTILCIVETPTDLIAIENTMQFKGRYFVLMGYLSPIDGIGSDELKINQLEKFLNRKSSMRLYWLLVQRLREKQRQPLLRLWLKLMELKLPGLPMVCLLVAN